jgi:hypothetical protein
VRRRLTLKGPDRSGEVVWDDEAGTFEGTDDAELNKCAQVPQWHPGLPCSDELAAHDAKALIILLHILGWDVPCELAEDAAAFLANRPPAQKGVVF